MFATAHNRRGVAAALAMAMAVTACGAATEEAADVVAVAPTAVVEQATTGLENVETNAAAETMEGSDPTAVAATSVTEPTATPEQPSTAVAATSVTEPTATPEQPPAATAIAEPPATAVPGPAPVSEPTPVPEPTAIPAPSAPAVIVPELTGQFTTIGGGQIDLGSLQGQDVVLWFWAPW